MLKKIKITTRSKVNNAKFKIRIFSVNKEGSPEDDLLYEDIIVTVKKGKRKNIIDISNLNGGMYLVKIIQKDNVDLVKFQKK